MIFIGESVIIARDCQASGCSVTGVLMQAKLFLVCLE
jgi:hypothetical protein